MLTIVRRRPRSSIDRRRASITTTLSLAGPPLLRAVDGVGPGAGRRRRPSSRRSASASSSSARWRSAAASASRPANRGVVIRGPYGLVRHPIYAGYLVTHVAFLVAHPDAVERRGHPVIADGALVVRALIEERVLSADESTTRIAGASAGTWCPGYSDGFEQDRARQRTLGPVAWRRRSSAPSRGERRRGLLGRDGLRPSAALDLAPCSSIHTAFMRFAIDVVFVDRDGRAEDRARPGAVADRGLAAGACGRRDGGRQPRASRPGGGRSSVPLDGDVLCARGGPGRTSPSPCGRRQLVWSRQWGRRGRHGAVLATAGAERAWAANPRNRATKL